MLAAPVIVVVVEDQASTLGLIEKTIRNLGSHIAFYGFESAESAMDFIEATPPDVLLLDVHMPGMNGIEFARRFRRYSPYLHVPILFLTGEQSNETRLEALQIGAVDYLLKPVRPKELELKLTNVVNIIRTISGHENAIRTLRERLVATMKDLEARERDAAMALFRVLHELPERPTSREDRIAQHVGELAAHCFLSATEQSQLVIACNLRDIGYVAVPTRILAKKRRFAADEWNLFQRHTIAGQAILGGASTSVLEMAANVARHHHERYDGKGYPDGLGAEHLTRHARIVALADRYDTLRSPRGYRRALVHEEAIRYIQAERGRAFDPELVDFFVEMKEIE
jgi:two-component system response regulator RpfG